MNNLHFAEPQWFHLFWGVVSLLLVMIWLERRLGRDLSTFMHPVLQSRLVKNSPPAKRYLRIILLSLSGCFLIQSLMRPQWGFKFVATPRVGAEIMVCLIRSGSSSNVGIGVRVRCVPGTNRVAPFICVNSTIK